MKEEKTEMKENFSFSSEIFVMRSEKPYIKSENVTEKIVVWLKNINFWFSREIC